jgi:hypothetical protein
LGDVGGFEQAINILLGLLGGFFSSNFLMASIASNIYWRKRNKQELIEVYKQ